jgi:hypothetical protein
MGFGGIGNIAAWTPYIVGGAVLLVALFMAAIALRRSLKARRARDWPAVPGQVVVSTIELRYGSAGGDGGGRTRAWYPVVAYVYAVGGRHYQGRNIVVGGHVGTGWQGPAQRVAARYPVGATVPVYYDPANPADAVLEKRAPTQWLLYAIAAGIVVFALVPLYFTVTMLGGFMR